MFPKRRLVMEKLYLYTAIFMAIMIVCWIVETIYLHRTKHDNHPSKYVNEIFYEEIMKQED